MKIIIDTTYNKKQLYKRLHKLLNKISDENILMKEYVKLLNSIKYENKYWEEIENELNKEKPNISKINKKYCILSFN